MSTTIVFNIKSVDDVLKIDVRIGFIRFVVPHHRLIRNMIDDSKIKSNKELTKDLKNFFANSRKYAKNIFKHSRVEKFYIAKLEPKMCTDSEIKTMYYYFYNPNKPSQHHFLFYHKNELNNNHYH